MAKTRIPSAIARFDAYIGTTDDHLMATELTSGNPYWQFLGLSGTNATDWHNKRSNWDAVLHKNWSDPDTKTKIVNDQVKTFIKDFQAFGNPLLDKIAVSDNATALDEKIFNLVLKKNRSKPSKSHTPIADECLTSFLSKGGGNIKTASRSSHDSKRASVAKGADGVQYAYSILDSNPVYASLTSASQPSPSPAAAIAPPESAPVHPDDGTIQKNLSGSSHLLQLGAENVGKFLCVWTRWFNSKHPELAGNWSKMQIVLIG